MKFLFVVSTVEWHQIRREKSIIRRDSAFTITRWSFAEKKTYAGKNYAKLITRSVSHYQLGNSKRVSYKKKLKRRQGGKDSSRYVDAMEVMLIARNLVSASLSSLFRQILQSYVSYCHATFLWLESFRKDTHFALHRLIARIQSNL